MPAGVSEVTNKEPRNLKLTTSLTGLLITVAINLLLQKVERYR